MKVLITGGSGFLGRAIVKQLLAAGHQVSVFCRGYYPDLVQANVECRQGNIENLNSLLDACQGIDAIIHTAAKAGDSGSYQSYFLPNVVGTRNVLTACESHKIQFLVHTSSPSVAYGKEGIEGENETRPMPERYLCAYSETKAIAEREVLSKNSSTLKTIALRPHLIWGPGDNHLLPQLVARARNKSLRLIKNNNALVDTTYITNAAYAHRLALENLTHSASAAGKVYFISQGEPVIMNDFINQLLALAKAPAVAPSLSPKLAYCLASILEFVYRLIPNRHPPVTRFLVSQMSTPHWFDLSAAKRDLGYQPLVSTKDGLKQLAQYLNESSANNSLFSRAPNHFP